jgi:hypothetical protein
MSEAERTKNFTATKEVMSYISIAGGMIPASKETAVQAGHASVPVTSQLQRTNKTAEMVFEGNEKASTL